MSKEQYDTSQSSPGVCLLPLFLQDSRLNSKPVTKEAIDFNLIISIYSVLV